MKLSFIILFGVFFAFPSYGYIDPGTSHLVWQFVAGIVIGMSFDIGKIRSALTKIFRSKLIAKK